ncbi:hypothetical protein, partial [Paenibacillus typhae]
SRSWQECLAPAADHGGSFSEGRAGPEPDLSVQRFGSIYFLGASGAIPQRKIALLVELNR